MKKVVMMACAALLAVSCGGDKKAEIKQMSGFVDGGTSMHVLVVDPIGGDAARQSFALDDATDLKEAYGLLEGNVVMVDYKAAGEGEMPVATKVACSKDYADAIGRWVMPDPVKEGEVMGVELRSRRQGAVDQHGDAAVCLVGVAGRARQADPPRAGASATARRFDVTDTAVLGENGGVPTLSDRGIGCRIHQGRVMLHDTKDGPTRRRGSARPFRMRSVVSPAPGGELGN